MEELKKALEERGYTVEEVTVNKANSSYEAIQIWKGIIGIYLPMKQIEEAEDLDDLLEYVEESFANSPVGEGIANVLNDYDTIKEKLFVRLVGCAANEQALKGYVVKEFLDLKELIYADLGGGATVVVTAQMAEHWGADPDELFSLAEANTAEKKPAIVKTMWDTLVELKPEIEDELPPEDSVSMMLVCTNESKVLGSASLLQTDVLKGVYEKYGEFFILPSSIHEVLFVTGSDDEIEGLRQMVKEVNDTQVPPVELLSYSVYRFDGETLSVA